MRLDTSNRCCLRSRLLTFVSDMAGVGSAEAARPDGGQGRGPLRRTAAVLQPRALWVIAAGSGRVMRQSAYRMKRGGRPLGRDRADGPPHRRTAKWSRTARQLSHRSSRSSRYALPSVVRVGKFDALCRDVERLRTTTPRSRDSPQCPHWPNRSNRERVGSLPPRPTRTRKAVRAGACHLSQAGGLPARRDTLRVEGGRTERRLRTARCRAP
jgi:hypothetical protein